MYSFSIDTTGHALSSVYNHLRLLLPTITLDFPAFTFSPLSRTLDPHSATRLPSYTIVASISTDPGCEPTFTSKLSLSPASVLTTAFFDIVVNQINHPPCTKTTSCLHHLTTTPVGAAAFPIFNPLLAATTSSSKMRQQGPSPQDNPHHHPRHFQHLRVSPYILHTVISIRHNVTDIIFSYIQHTLMTFLPSLTICRAILKQFFLSDSL